MKIFVTGTRGIPNIPGGVEKHCEELYQRIAKRGHEVFLANRSSYVSGAIREWRGVQLINCYSPKSKSFEALVHTFIAILRGRLLNPDVVHIHAIGPSLLTPFARLMGLKAVVTNHGPEYNRHKWGTIAKFVLQLGEKIGAMFANEVIAVSSVIRDIIREKCHRNSTIIFNGVSIQEKSKEYNFLEKIGAEPRKYILAVARFVPEKGLHDLISAFKKIDCDCKLVIAGDADYETDYSTKLRKMASEDGRVILTGYLTGESLNQVFTHAHLFVLPSYHEGLPIALLEALSYGIPVLVSDIPANKEVGLPAQRYFKCGEVSELKAKMVALLENGFVDDEREKIQFLLSEKYNWNKIADQTMKVYETAIN